MCDNFADDGTTAERLKNRKMCQGHIANALQNQVPVLPACIASVDTLTFDLSVRRVILPVSQDCK